MKIREFYYDDYKERLFVEFSTITDGNDFYRTLDLGYEEVEYYSLTMVEPEDMLDIDETFVREVVVEYLKDNTPPERHPL